MAHSNVSPAEGEPTTDEIRHGRRAAAWTAVPEWVIVAGLSPQALALYVTLLAHVNRKREDGAAWPGMDALCALLGFKHRNSITGYLRELAAVGAVDVQRQQRSMVRRNVYIVHELPPAAHIGPVSLAEFHKARKRNDLPRHTEMCVGRHTQIGAAMHTQMGQNHTNPTTRNERDEDASSGDASAAVGQRTSSPTERETRTRAKLHIVQPRNFKLMDEGEVARKLTGACIAAMAKAGLVPAENAADALGRSFKKWLEEGTTRQELLALVRENIQHAGTDHKGWGWLAVRDDVPAPDPWAA